MSAKPRANAEGGAPPGLNGAIVAVAAIGLAMTVVSATLARLGVTLSIAGGAAIAAANLWMLGRIVMAFASAPPHVAGDGGIAPSAPIDATSEANAAPEEDEHRAPRGKVAAWSVLALLKLIVLFGGAYQLMRAGVVVPLALVLGYSSLPIGITLAQLFGKLKN